MLWYSKYAMRHPPYAEYASRETTKVKRGYQCTVLSIFLMIGRVVIICHALIHSVGTAHPGMKSTCSVRRPLY